MDRRTVFPGQLPLETDLLATGQHAMVALAKLAEATLGIETVADGFALTPTVPLSLAVNLSPGSIYQQVQLEQSAWSSLPPDVRPIVKQGITLDPETIPLTSPPTVGYAHNVLIQVQYGDDDDGEIVRPYYNAGNPSVPFSGPGNSNQEQPTTRRGKVVTNTKYGPAAANGSQPTPTPDPGWIGLFVVTVPNGSTQITGGQIQRYVNAPTVLAKLPAIPTSIQQNTWTFVADTSVTPNLVTGSPTPALKAYNTATELKVLVGNTNTDEVTINISNLGLRPLTRRDGTVLQPGDIVRGSVVTINDDGTKYRLASLAQGEVARIVNTPVFYVRTDGNDNNDGSANTSVKAFATIKGAILNGTNRLTLAGRTATIILGIPGSYAAPNFPGTYANAEASIQSSGTLLIQGNRIANGDTTNQQEFTIFGTGAAATTGIMHIAYGAQVILRGLRIQNDSATTYHTLTTSTGSAVYVEYLTLAGAGLSSGSHFYSADGAVCKIGPGCIIASSAGYAFYAQGGGVTIQGNVGPFTFQGNLAFSIAVATAENSGGRMLCPSGGAGFTLTGSVTGKKYNAAVNGSINVFGAGINYFPGNVAGTQATGGQYV